MTIKYNKKNERMIYLDIHSRNLKDSLKIRVCEMPFQIFISEANAIAVIFTSWENADLFFLCEYMRTAVLENSETMFLVKR